MAVGATNASVCGAQGDLRREKRRTGVNTRKREQLGVFVSAQLRSDLEKKSVCYVTCGKGFPGCANTNVGNAEMCIAAFDIGQLSALTLMKTASLYLALSCANTGAIC